MTFSGRAGSVVTPSVLAVLVTVMLAVVALATERVAVKVVAISAIGTLVIAGVLTPAQAFSASCSFITPFEPSCILVWDTASTVSPTSRRWAPP